MRERLAELTRDRVRAAGAAIGRRVAQMPAVTAATWVAGYVSFGTEVPTHELLRGLLSAGKRVCVPSFDPVGQRYFCSEVKHFDTELIEGKWGCWEPKHTVIRPVPMDRLDVWLVPGLAFDERGNRLGRGMGYFDQMLRDARGLKIGLAYDIQVLREVPAEKHDVRMDFIVTETRVVNCER